MFGIWTGIQHCDVIPSACQRSCPMLSECGLELPPYRFLSSEMQFWYLNWELNLKVCPGSTVDSHTAQSPCCSNAQLPAGKTTPIRNRTRGAASASHSICVQQWCRPSPLPAFCSSGSEDLPVHESPTSYYTQLNVIALMSVLSHG